VGDISDCDDSDPEINPEAEEIMNDGIDNNCDHLIDALPGEQPIMMDSSYNGPAALDRDRDGYSEISDCDDLYAWANPGLHEICDDGIDNNCDTLIDEPDCMPGPNSVQDLHEAEEEDIEEDITESLDKISGSLISGEDDIPIIDLEEDVVEDTGQNTQGTSSNLINLAGADATFNNFPPGEVDQITAREHGWQLVTLPGDGVFIEEGTHSGNYLCLYPYRDDDQAYHPFISSLAINGIQLIPGEVYELSFSYRARTKREIVFVLRDEEGHPIGERTYEKLRKTRGNNWKRSTVHFTVADDVDLDQGTLSIGWGSLRKPLHLDNIYFRLVDEI
jgi:hypothetical protein